ncbi:hypothetical protein, partial [Sediminibacterium sp.]|uniref:hypothetical protein n=1 Tax=Sediminibacterium sp. TaxID=1917865 RepID=UPI002733DA68
ATASTRKPIPCEQCQAPKRFTDQKVIARSLGAPQGAGNVHSSGCAPHARSSTEELSLFCSAICFVLFAKPELYGKLSRCGEAKVDVATVSVLYWGSHFYRGLQPGIVVRKNKTKQNNQNNNNNNTMSPSAFAPEFGQRSRSHRSALELREPAAPHLSWLASPASGTVHVYNTWCSENQLWCGHAPVRQRSEIFESREPAAPHLSWLTSPASGTVHVYNTWCSENQLWCGHAPVRQLIVFRRVGET